MAGTDIVDFFISPPVDSYPSLVKRYVENELLLRRVPLGWFKNAYLVLASWTADVGAPPVAGRDEPHIEHTDI